MKVISLTLIQNEGIQTELAKKRGTGPRLHQGLLTLWDHLGWTGVGPCSLWWCWQVNEVVNMRVLPAFGLGRSEHFSWQEYGGETHCWGEKDLGLLGECRETPGLWNLVLQVPRSLLCIGLMEGWSRISQSWSVIPWSGQHFVSWFFSYTWQKSFQLHASHGVWEFS